MSAFEVNITPPQNRSALRRKESREPTMVIMAPFSPKAIVQFEDVPVSKTAKRILKIVNPSDQEILVNVINPLKPDCNLKIDWTEKCVAADSEVEMLIVWSPLLETKSIETLYLRDDRNFRQEVTIILKSIPDKIAKRTKKFPNVSSASHSSYVKTLRLKSPTSKKKVHNVSSKQQQKRNERVMPKLARPVAPTENWAKSKFSVPIMKPRQPLADQNLPKGYPLISTPYHDTDKAASSPNDTHFGYKENICPETPDNVIDLIDNINFTPLDISEIPPKVLNFDDLASLATPVISEHLVDVTEKVTNLRPRRLSAEYMASSDIPSIMISPDPKSISFVVTDKTFEVNKTDVFDATVDLINYSALEERLTLPDVVLNKTETITNNNARPLSMIKEEDVSAIATSESPNPLHCTYVKEKPISVNVLKDLKRDVELIGSPLRKHSESMKDLSSSGISKLAIQGSMPNLNDMEKVRSFEQNRYLHEKYETRQKRMSIIYEQIREPPTEFKIQPSFDDLANVSSTSQIGMFCQNEILAQSSRFNINEIGMKSCKNSPAKSTIEKEKPIERKPEKQEKNTNVNITSKKRGSHELSFSDEQLGQSKIFVKDAETVFTSKRRREHSATSFLPSSIDISVARINNWVLTEPKKFKVGSPMKKMSPLKMNEFSMKPLTPHKVKMVKPVKLYDSDLFLQTYINPDPFAATTTADPFLASTMYLDARAVEKHQIDFKKWLNALVTIPADLEADCDRKIDVGKLFNEVRHKDLTLAPSKEEQSMTYLTTFRLDNLRKAAIELFLSDEMRLPCSKVAVYINKDALRIRSDRNLHLDVVMQRNILELLLCVNPLWLRLGLEVVFGEKINLQSNNDVIGLSTFILNRLFRDKYLELKHSRAYALSADYANYVKKHTLQKMLFLFLFLDKAKNKHIIKQNPCLFVKNSPHKQTKDLLLRFASELLANLGDITRDLKRMGYVLEHKQSYLDEFDYAFCNLATDLRDGVRLTRVMEIILLRDDLSKSLRVPAISRLQRIHNVNLGLRALNEANFMLKGDITAADIVDGHREKTLSLLWQIIYIFRSPKFHAAATVLQQWWRKIYLRVIIQRSIKKKIEMRRIKAVTKIQALFRGKLARKFVKKLKAERNIAAVVIQKYIRRHLAIKNYKFAIKSIIRIQRIYRARLIGVIYRQRFLKLKQATIYVQHTFRRRMVARQLREDAKIAKLQYEQKRLKAIICIQKYWRGYKYMKRMRADFLQIRKTVILIQTKYRAKLLMKKERLKYMRLHWTAVVMQRHYRAKRLMVRERENYQNVREKIIMIQRRRRAIIEMRKEKKAYEQQLCSIIKVQRRMRATLLAKKVRASYLKLRKSVEILQVRYRAHTAMKRDRAAYIHLRKCILVIQRKWRATREMRHVRYEFFSIQHYTIILQQTYRGKKLMQMERAKYLRLRENCILIQCRYRALLQMRQERAKFLSKKAACIQIQRKYRAYKEMRFMRAKYQGRKAAAICIQKYYRKYLIMRKIRVEYLQKQKAAIVLQHAYRARLAMKLSKTECARKRAIIIFVQRLYRRKLEMRKQMQLYKYQRHIIIGIQRRFRAKLKARIVRMDYMRVREILIKMQRRIHAKHLMLKMRAEYLDKREKAIKIQRFWRACLCKRKVRADYLHKYEAIVRIQRWFRLRMPTVNERRNYLRLRYCVVQMQRKWRAKLIGRQQQQTYKNIRKCILLIQRKFRAQLLMRKQRQEYLRLKNAATVIQIRYRAYRLMLYIKNGYLLIRSLVKCLQMKYRGYCLMKEQRCRFLALRRATIFVQQKFRATQLARVEREKYLNIQRFMPKFQACLRGFIARKRFQALMTPDMIKMRQCKKAAKIIQRYWRGYRLRKKIKNSQLTRIRKNIVELKQKANVESSVRNKVQDSVRVLRNHVNGNERFRVLARLDRLSRCVPQMLICQANFISTFCYGIMAQAIRSEEDKHIIEMCCRIMLNMARYNKSDSAPTFQGRGLVTIAQILLRWCDKDSEIFNTLCTLIWLFAHCPEKREILREFMTTTEAIYLIRETKRNVLRKEKMKQNVRKPVPTKQNVGQPQFSSRALPSLEPDYGVVRNKPYIFISSVYAFDTVLCKLGIKIF